MQKKQPPKELPPSSQNIMATILQSMPKEASITKIEYEGPMSSPGAYPPDVDHVYVP